MGKFAEVFLGRQPAADVDVEVRAELPIVGSPYQSVNAVNLVGLNDTVVSVDRALTLTAVNRCVGIVATDVSQLPLVVYANGAVAEQASTSIAVRPNSRQPMHAFLQETVISLATHGNAYWLNDKASADTTLSRTPVKNVYVLDPASTTIEVDADGNRWFREGTTKYPWWRVTHLKHTRLPGYTYGVGPIQMNQNELRGAIDLRNYADNWFREGHVPTGVLTTDKQLNEVQADAHRRRWEELNATGRGTVVLSNGVSYTPIALDPKAAQFVENRQFTDAQICRAFGVPGIKLGIPSGDTSTYSNMQDVDITYLRDTLMLYVKEIEAAFTDLFPRGTEIRMDVSGLLRADLYTNGTGTGLPANPNERSDNA